MSAVDDVIVDLDAALYRLSSAIGTDEVETRRALRESLACLYELRVYREGNSHQERTAYRERAASSHGGKHAEGIVWLRGKKTHELLAKIAPTIVGLYPSEHTFPGQYTYPRTNLTWAPARAMPLVTGDVEVARRRLYEDLVQGQPVLEGLQAARTFLACDPGPMAE
jgi:hypothetical protein